MSKCSNSNNVLVEIFDNGKEVIAICKTCQKRMETYRQIRYHYSTIHDLTKIQFKRVSKVGRLLK